MNKGTSFPQAELKLVYYVAPFEIHVGGNHRSQQWGLSSQTFFCFVPFVLCTQAAKKAWDKSVC